MTAPGTGHQDPSAEVLTEAAAAFGLLASPARLHIVWALLQRKSDVTGLAERVGGALPAVSQSSPPSDSPYRPARRAQRSA